MIPVKIQCACGQRYAFDVEPVGGRMPGPVSCPVCGADGTVAADAIIAGSMPTRPVSAAAPARGPQLRTTVAAPHTTAAPRTTALLPGQVDRIQAEHEARAKISWGDPPAAVARYLMMQGFSQGEASRLVEAMFDERAATIRRNGIGKILAGSGLVCVPVVAFVVFRLVGFFPLKLFAIALMVGCYGAWMVLKGTFMFLAPKSEAGDVAEQ